MAGEVVVGVVADGGADAAPGLWTIDSAFIESAARELAALAEFMDRAVGQRWEPIRHRMGAGGSSSPFGGSQQVPNAGTLWTKHAAFVTQGASGVTSLVARLRAAAQGAGQVAVAYQTTEQRNAANAADVERLLGGSGSSASGSPSPGSSSSEPAAGSVGGGF